MWSWKGHLPRPHLYKCGRGRCPFHDHIFQYVVVEGGKFFSNARQKPFHFPPTFTLNIHSYLHNLTFTFTSSLHNKPPSLKPSPSSRLRPLSSLSFLSPSALRPLASLSFLSPSALRPPPPSRLRYYFFFYFSFFFFL